MSDTMIERAMECDRCNGLFTRLVRLEALNQDICVHCLVAEPNLHFKLMEIQQQIDLAELEKEVA